jgi:hypothetical protein
MERPVGWNSGRLVCLAYRPPASSIFLLEQTSYQQSASRTFLSEQINTSHQPPAKRTDLLVSLRGVTAFFFPRKPGLKKHAPQSGEVDEGW